MSRPPHPPWFNHPKSIRIKNTGCEVHHYAVFSTIRLTPFMVQISSSTLCSQKPLVCSPPSKRETKFSTHTVQVAKLQFCVL
jgi:hypothetical protein